MIRNKNDKYCAFYKLIIKLMSLINTLNDWRKRSKFNNMKMLVTII